jgi:hypothetical protein
LTLWDSDYINQYLYMGMKVHVWYEPAGSPGPEYASDGPFADVPANHTFAGAISWMASEGVAVGCRPYFFCPDSPTKRGETAAFLMRTLRPYLGTASPIEFTDTEGHVFETAVEWIAGHRITQGCNPPSNTHFCPENSLTRGQFAAMVKRAVGDLIPVDESKINPGRFVDTQESVFRDAAAWLAAAGITKGCNPPDNDRFCPGETLTRAQISAFLKRVVDRL